MSVLQNSQRFVKQTTLHDAPRIIGHGHGKQYHFPSVAAINKYCNNGCAQIGYRVSLSADDKKKKKFYPEINFSDTGVADIYFAIQSKHLEKIHASNGRDYLKYSFSDLNGETQEAFNDLIDYFEDAFKHISKYHFNDMPIGKFYVPNILVPIIDNWQEKCLQSNNKNKLLIKIYQIVCHPQTRGVLDCEIKFALAKKVYEKYDLQPQHNITDLNSNSNSNENINNESIINKKRKIEHDDEITEESFEKELNMIKKNANNKFNQIYK